MIVACSMATARAMHPANVPTLHGGGFTAASCPLGCRGATRRIRKALGGVHGVVGGFHLHPPPVVEVVMCGLKS